MVTWAAVQYIVWIHVCDGIVKTINEKRRRIASFVVHLIIILVARAPGCINLSTVTDTSLLSFFLTFEFRFGKDI